jgi:prepilin-type N-terminal cleavage/methylation domain-containing protein
MNPAGFPYAGAPKCAGSDREASDVAGRGGVRAAGFTLVELMIVISIMMLLMSFAAPTMSGILKGKKTDQAIGALTAVFENARMEAVVQNTYLWVGLMNKKSSGTPSTPSGQDEVWVMTFKGKMGEKRLTGDNRVIPAASLRRLEGVSILDLGSLPQLVSEKVSTQTNETASFGDFIKSPPSSVSVAWVGNSETGSMEFNQLILFTPRGEALLENGLPDTLPKPVPYVAMGLGKTVDGAVGKTDKDLAAILIGGFNGRVGVVRP